jgi:predicted hotdog family 3-hydroxylacyl-ACP dehydratase
MQLNRAWIEAHIPHHGRMCLLDEVLNWGPEQISCRSHAHRAVDHPLRAHGRLGIACGIEFTAQAMAVHGALIAEGSDVKPIAGFLARIRGVRMHVLRLDDVQGDLICDAVRIAGDQGTALYDFEMRSSGVRLMSGRATVVLDSNYRLDL